MLALGQNAHMWLHGLPYSMVAGANREHLKSKVDGSSIFYSGWGSEKFH